MRRAATKLRTRDPRACAERRHRFEQAMGQHKHRHDDVFGDRRLVAEHVANGDPFWHRGGIEEVETGRHRLQQAKARRGREPRAPDMTDHDLRIRQQRGKLFYIALIVEDRGVQRRLHLGENSRSDRPSRSTSFTPTSGTRSAPLKRPPTRASCALRLTCNRALSCALTVTFLLADQNIHL